MENQVYLLFGGNQGDVPKVFSLALERIKDEIGPVISVSPLYTSEPWGFDSCDLFLNQVVQVSTCQNAETVLTQVLDIEKELGRIRHAHAEGYSSRVIDIDILFFNDSIIQTESLVVPHPRLHLRNFTLVPLNDISPRLMHPVLNKTIGELVENSADKLKVVPYMD